MLYNLFDYQYKILDKYEAVPWNYLRKYLPCDNSPTGLMAVYIGNNPTERLPLYSYLTIIVEGCRNHGLVKTTNKIMRLAESIKYKSHKKRFSYDQEL